MWRDESQAFLLARDSKDLSELWQNVRYEGHPILWHSILFIAYHLVPSIYTIQVVHLLIGLSVAALIIFYSPFSFFEKFLLCFSYFLSFEYLAISRNYSIGIFLLFLSVCLFNKSKSKSSIVQTAIIVGLAANSNIYATIISCFLFVYFFASTFPLNKTSSYKSKLFYISGIVFVIFLTIALLQLVAPADRRPKLTVAANVNFKRMGKILKEVSNALFYLPAPLKDNKYWGTSIFESNYFKSSFLNKLVFFLPQLLTICMIVLALYTWYKHSRAVFWFFTSSFVALLLFMYFIFDRGLLRHTGAFFVLLLLSLWLYNASSKSERKPTTYFNYLFSILLLTQFAASVIVHVYEIKYPFSGAKEAAAFLLKTGRNNNKIVLHPDFEGMALLHYAGINEIYYPTINGYGSFIKFNDKRKPRSNRDIYKIALRDEIETMVFNGRKSDSAINAIGYELIYSPTIHSTVPDEDFWIYGKKHR